MATVVYSVVTQSLTFLPLALGISISYTLLRATDMTLDGSFVLGAAVFARLIECGLSAPTAAIIALASGALAGMMTALIQRGGKVDSLLAGILATFILASVNLVILGKPNINLLSYTTLLSTVFSENEWLGWVMIGVISSTICLITGCIIQSRFGLTLRALGDNAGLLKRLGTPIERYRLFGFALTNLLAAAAGCLTAETAGYADIGMGFGMTLTGIGAIMIGQQLIRFVIKNPATRLISEFSACLCGVLLYFFAMNILLRLNVDPIYLKMLFGCLLIIFLRTAIHSKASRNIA